ncbi:reverse transcriptase domain-containing protein [Tanacetum coccineum]|uniref:Reverse transcriptase domain-containing protein n=1 Tax=Tanacetum coccineum TaxID=301880 RepID=A0ABQ5C469_9ASTR
MKRPQHYLTEMQEVILFYNGLEVLNRQILDSKGAIPTKTAAGAKRRQLKEESRSKFMNEKAKIQEENSNLIKEIRASIDTAIRNQGASIKALEIQIGKMSKVLQERGSGSLPSSTEMNQRDHTQQNSKLIFEPKQATIPFPSRLYNNCYEEEKGSYGVKDLDTYSIRTMIRDDALSRKEKHLGSFTLPYYISNVCFEKALVDLGASVSVTSLSTYLKGITVELADNTMKHPKGITENVLVGIKFVFLVDFIILDMPEDVNVPLILERPFLSTTHVKVDVFKRKITLRVRYEKMIFKRVKPASSLIKKVYMLSLKEKMNFDLEARLMGKTLILNRSFDPLYGDYIKLKDLNEPQELRRNRVDDLKPTVEEGEVVDEPITDIVKTRWNFIGGLDDYPSECDFDRRIHINYSYNLKFSCIIGFEYVHTNFLLILPINVMFKRFYNTVMKDKIKFKGRNELGNFVNALVFIGNFYVVTDFIVVEDMVPYLDEEIGDVIVGEPFLQCFDLAGKKSTTLVKYP